MATRKISDCINIRINVGNYQHIELVKYVEEQIDYQSEEERKQKEDSLRNDLVDNLIRSMKAIPERLGKGVENAVEVEERIKKAIPEWLEKNPIPNIANGAKKLEISSAAEQKDKKDKMADLADAETSKPKAKVEEKKAQPTKDDDVSDKPLFEDDLESGKSDSEKPEQKEEKASANTVKEEAVKEDKKSSALFDDDDDLFK